ncbi:MAG: hypothetical protein PHP86_18005 [Nevskiales bacterium]|nr:hypothetical protein [Nevskiales bacterium]
MAIQELSKEEVAVVSGGAASLDGVWNLVGGLVTTVLSLPLLGTVVDLADKLVGTLSRVVGGLLGGRG